MSEVNDYSVDLPSNRPGFAGLLGRTESLFEAWEQTGEVTHTIGGALIAFSDISMPVHVAANSDGAGSGIVRPWMGAPRGTGEKVGEIAADLELGVLAYGTHTQLLRLTLSNFRRHLPDRKPGKPLTIGRPITATNDFGNTSSSEAYTALSVRAIVSRGTITQKAGIYGTAKWGDTFELPLNVPRNAPIHKHPAYLLASTCLLAADRRSIPSQQTK